MNHFYVLQNNQQEFNVNTTFIEKLYNLIQQQNKTNDAYDSNTNFVGEINTGITYQEYIDTINAKFPYLIIHPSDICIMFADSNVENILKTYYPQNDGGITKSLSVDQVNGFYVNRTQIFNGNTNIVTFDELNQLENVKILGYGSFQNCTSLQSINLTNIETLTGYTFRGCTSLSMAVNMPKLKNINDNNNFRDSGVTSIKSLGTITKIPQDTFNNCKSLTTVENDALQNITTIEGGAFSGCTNLTDLGSLQNLTRIQGWSSFYGCTKLASIDWDQSKIIELGYSTFAGCENLVINDLNMPNLANTALNGVFQKVKIKQISNIGNVTELNDVCFKDNKELTKVNNNALQNVITINAFNGCSSLTDIGNIPNAQTFSSFGACTSLASIKWDSTKVITINGYCFSGCTSLVIGDLNLPNLTTLGIQAFARTQIHKISNLGNITSLNESVFFEITTLTEVTNTALSNITSIGRQCFRNCTSLSIIGNMSNVRTIDNHAFAGCTSLTNITLPNELSSLGNNAFNGCTNLRSINIPSNITTLSERLFNECTSLVSLTIDWSKIKKIDEAVFYKCTSFGIGETVDVNLTEQTTYPKLTFAYTQIKKLIVHMNINNADTYDARYPLHEAMGSLEYLDYSDTNLGIWAQIYGYLATNYAYTLTTYILPSTINKYDSGQSDLKNLQYLIILVENPSQITNLTGSGANYFKGTGNSIPLTCNIYVKDATVRAAYLAHEFWGTIPNASTRIKTLSELPTGVWNTGLYQQYEPYLSNH